MREGKLPALAGPCVWVFLLASWAGTDSIAGDPQYISTMAGSGVAGFNGDGLPPKSTAFYLPQDGEFGPRLFDSAPDRCCEMRKVEPLERALRDYDAWATGVRRGETAARANTREIDYDKARGKVKVAPIARWSDADVAAYIERYDIPVTELLNQGYGSIGCWPCTRKVQPGEDARAGRWAAFDKTECGLHT